ncbi:hypothetical protein [uncultured Jatrophihabitans sp.]|uniref:hypothetical protein n=1 Tax=uncultured Jatrophihabitans sp. TaxID=1610747 RepID=UPI0035CA2390
MTLVAVAVLLVAGVLGVQVAHGGGDYTPLRPADPCVARPVTSVSKGIEGLTERLVLIGLDGAACRLHTSREALTLQLAQPGPRTTAQVNAVRAGLLGAVTRMKADGTLPRSSGLANEALGKSNLNGFLKAALRALPDSFIDKNLKTDDVLRRAINKLDLRAVLGELNDPDELNKRVNAAVTSAVKDALIARLRSLL